MTLSDALVADALVNGATVENQAKAMALYNVARLKQLHMPLGVYLRERIKDLRQRGPDTEWNRAVIATYEAILRGEPV